MRIALDSPNYVGLCKGDKQIIEAVRAAENIFLPFIVIAELKSGLQHAKVLKNAQKLTLFLNQNRVEILYPDRQTIDHYAWLHFQLKKQGTHIPQNDLWIAALVAQHNLYLCSRDKHFDAFPQIPRV